MAYRQYIGARYVPLYVGDWDSTRNYEPLSIVTDGNGNSYTSLRDVPAGTQLNNRDYWILTSSFSGAVEQLGRRVSALETEVGQDGQDITALDGRVTKLENPPRGNIVFLGDSYVQANSLGADQGQRFSTQVATNLSLTEFNFADGGSGFIPASGEIDFLQQANNAVATMTADEKTNTKIIVVAGGRNDAGASTSALSSAMVETIRVLKSNFRNAKIAIAPMLFGDMALPQRFFETYSAMVQIVNSLPFNGNITLIQNCYKWIQGCPSMMMPDNVHWTVAGHKKVAEMMTSAIEGKPYLNAGGVSGTLPNTGDTGTYAINVANGQLDIYIDLTCDEARPRAYKILDAIEIGNIGFATGKNVIGRLDSVNSSTSIPCETIVSPNAAHTTCIVQIQLLAAMTNAGRYMYHLTTSSDVGN